MLAVVCSLRYYRLGARVTGSQLYVPLNAWPSLLNESSVGRPLQEDIVPFR